MTTQTPKIFLLLQDPELFCEEKQNYSSNKTKILGFIKGMEDTNCWIKVVTLFVYSLHCVHTQHLSVNLKVKHPRFTVRHFFVIVFPVFVLDAIITVFESETHMRDPAPLHWFRQAAHNTEGGEKNTELNTKKKTYK